MKTEYPDQYLYVEEMSSGEHWIVALTADEPLDLQTLVEAWIADTFGGEIELDGEIQNRLDGEYYAKVMTDGREPDSATCWYGGGFYTKIA